MEPIFETENFMVIRAEHPYVSREEGGHLYINPKVPVSDRTKLSPQLAIEYMKLSMIVGEALTIAMQKQGIDIGIVNYQDMGNWMVYKPGGPIMHLHIYGRAKTATKQKYGDAVYLPHIETGFFKDFIPLNTTDMQLIREEIIRLLHTEKYVSF